MFQAQWVGSSSRTDKRECAHRFNGHFISRMYPLIMLLHLFLDCESPWVRPNLFVFSLTQFDHVFRGRLLDIHLDGWTEGGQLLEN